MSKKIIYVDYENMGNLKKTCSHRWSLHFFYRKYTDFNSKISGTCNKQHKSRMGGN